MCKNILDIKCTDENIFQIATTHPSFTTENNLSHLQNYERLEFLGDSVLKLYCSKILMEKFPEYDEGKLSKIRSILVSDATISQLGFKIGLNNIIRMAESEEKQGGRKRESNIACAMEAVIGAYYLDGKKEEIERFLKYNLNKYIEDIDNNFAKFNAKAVLQEYTQAKTKELPEYETIAITGPAHKPRFEVQVKYENKIIATGFGSTKRDAQQDCAYKACIKLGIIEVKNE